MESTKEYVLSDMEKDAVGEIANMCMGSAATALSTILGRTVAITTPEVMDSNWKEICTGKEPKYVCVKVGYTAGMTGSNVLLLDENDALSISNIMIGMDSAELTELELSAMGEVTNQMIGASTTTLSNILGEMVDISPPDINVINGENVDDVFGDDEHLNGGFIQIKFRLEIEGLVDSFMLQVFPYTFLEAVNKNMEMSIGADDLQDEVEESGDSAQVKADKTEEVKVSQNNNAADATATTSATSATSANVDGQTPQMMPMGQGMMPNMMGMPYMYMPNMAMAGQVPFDGNVQNNVNVQSAQFTSFVNNKDVSPEAENINLIMDVPLEVTVELGRTNKSISEILEFKPGTIVELNKVAGDPIDVLVNGKRVAVGEVVVIDENFGIRIVDIIK